MPDDCANRNVEPGETQVKPGSDQDDSGVTGTDITGTIIRPTGTDITGTDITEMDITETEITEIDITGTEIKVMETLQPRSDDCDIKSNNQNGALNPSSNEDGATIKGIETKLDLIPEISDINSNVEITGIGLPLNPNSNVNDIKPIGSFRNGTEISLVQDISDAQRDRCRNDVGMEEEDSAEDDQPREDCVQSIDRLSSPGLEIILEDYDAQKSVDRMEGSLFSQDSITWEDNSGPIPPVRTVITTADDPEPAPASSDSGPLIRVIPPAALALKPDSGPSSARKSPVTVQEWVDSLPPPRLREETAADQWEANRATAAGLKREASVQSDAGSHCSSVESLLGSRRPDPEEILMGLGFGGASNDFDSDVARIPRRFLRPSKVKGVAIDDFLRHQHDLVQTFESGFYGYRGLTGPGYRPPSVIVAKIMEKLRGIRPSLMTSTPNSTPGSTGKRFSRMARKVINVLPSSVLTPDNRQFLDDQGGKSPEVPRKRMIIGQRSFTFDHDGHMIELRQPGAPSGSLSASSSDSDTSALVKEHRAVSAGSTEELNLSSITRSPSVETEPSSSLADLSCDSFSIAPASCDAYSIAPATCDAYSKPALSVSSRSNSVDSSEALPPAWDAPVKSRYGRNYSTSVSSWESNSPRVELDRSFSRYESIEETSERGSESVFTADDGEVASPAAEGGQTVSAAAVTSQPGLSTLEAVRQELPTAETLQLSLATVEVGQTVLPPVNAMATTTTADSSSAENVKVLIDSSKPMQSDSGPAEDILEQSFTAEHIALCVVVVQPSVPTESNSVSATKEDVAVTEKGSKDSVPTKIGVSVPAENDVSVPTESDVSVPTENGSGADKSERETSTVPTERVSTTLQQRRGSLKRQQCVEEDVNVDDILSPVDNKNSHGTLSNVNEVDVNDADYVDVNDADNVDVNDVDTISMNSSRMEELLNPGMDLRGPFQESGRVDSLSFQMDSIDIEEVEVVNDFSRKRR